MSIGFENLKEMSIGEIKDIEGKYSKIPEGRFKMADKIIENKKDNFAEELVEDLK